MEMQLMGMSHFIKNNSQLKETGLCLMRGHFCDIYLYIYTFTVHIWTHECIIMALLCYIVTPSSVLGTFVSFSKFFKLL